MTENVINVILFVSIFECELRLCLYINTCLYFGWIPGLMSQVLISHKPQDSKWWSSRLLQDLNWLESQHIPPAWVLTQWYSHCVTKAVTKLRIFATPWRSAEWSVDIAWRCTRNAKSQTLPWSTVHILTRSQVNQINIKLWEGLIEFTGLKV